jgi:hypothetical protein
MSMKFPRTAVLVASLATLVVAFPAGAINSVPTWQAASIVALPSGATGLPQGYLPALSCPSIGNCAAGGAYADASGNTQGLLLEKVAGVWRPPKRLVAPADAAANPAVTIGALSCARARDCAVGGSYQEKGGNSLSLVANEVKGRWSAARKVVLPADAMVTGQNSTIRSLSCASAGNCSAVGAYLVKTSPLGHFDSYVVSEVRGSWGHATGIVVPAGANVNPFVSINQVACPSVGNCSAVGSYIDANGVTHGLTVDEVGGAWAASRPLTLPGDANAFPGAILSEISCVSTANCTALGNYTNVTGAIEGLAVTELHGQWGRAVAMRMPPGAASNPHVFFYGFNGLSCPSLGNCSAGGQYRDGTQLYQGFLVDEVKGRWTTATALALPSGAQAAGKNGGVVAVSCTSAGNCSAGAAFLDSAGNYQALIVVETAGTWFAGTTVRLPPGATTVGVDGGVYGLVCNTATSCTATGSYLGSTTTYQGFTVATS